MSALLWRCRDHVWDLESRPIVLGIVNVTPDSFSDGGQFHDPVAAVDHAHKLIAEGADILDLGGESTRPGSEPVSTEDELARVLPVVRRLAGQISVPISIDTMKASVAEACLDAGAAIVNDVSGLLGDPRMPEVVARYRAGAIVMHMQGTPATMQVNPQYDDVVTEIDRFFGERLATLAERGIAPEQIALDPGIGFGKTHEHTLRLLANLDRFRHWKRPICLGVSRKGFLGIITGRARNDRVAATLSVNCLGLWANAAQILRVHDVGPNRDAALIAAALAPYRSS